MKTYHYTYISFDENGNKYHGVRSCKSITPWEDSYLGSFEDKNFVPIGKFVQKIFSCRRTAERFESWFHKTNDVANSPNWVNQINAPCGWSEKCVENSIKPRMGKRPCINSSGDIKLFVKCERDWQIYRRNHDAGKKWWTNKLTGKKIKAFEDPGPDWEQMGNNTTGTKWWINKITGKRKRSKVCPGENWTNVNARNKTKATSGKIWVIELLSNKRILIEKELFDKKLHKKSGPNANKTWQKDPETGKRIYSS